MIYICYVFAMKPLLLKLYVSSYILAVCCYISVVCFPLYQLYVSQLVQLHISHFIPLHIICMFPITYLLYISHYILPALYVQLHISNCSINYQLFLSSIKTYEYTLKLLIFLWLSFQSYICIYGYNTLILCIIIIHGYID